MKRIKLSEGDPRRIYAARADDHVRFTMRSSGLKRTGRGKDVEVEVRYNKGHNWLEIRMMDGYIRIQPIAANTIHVVHRSS